MPNRVELLRYVYIAVREINGGTRSKRGEKKTDVMQDCTRGTENEKETLLHIKQKLCAEKKNKKEIKREKAKNEAHIRKN